MSISSLPEWKQLLLDRKRKGEDTRERQVQEDEKRLASMPAWKLEVIQRRKAKQEGDGGPQTVDGRAVEENTSEAELPKGFWSTCTQGFRNGPEPQSQVSVENIGPVRHNPFILSQNIWRGERAGEGGPSKKEQSEESGSCQRDYNIDYEGEKHQNVKCKRTGNGGDCGESEKPREGESGRHCLRRKGGGNREQKDPGTEYLVCPLSVPRFRTIQAENVITAELEISATGKKALRNKRREEEMEAEQEKMKEGRTMNLRSTTEVRGDGTEMKASVMKPSASVKDRSEACQPMYSERKGSRSGTGANEERHEKEEVIYTLGEKEEAPGGDKTRSRMKVGRIWANKQVKTREKEAEADRSIREDLDAGAPVGSFGHVSRLLSKFGEQHKPPLRSSSMDCFTSRDGGGGRGSVEEESALRERESWTQRKEEREEVQGSTVKGVPMRSFRFSEHVVSDMENRADDEDCIERKVVELKYSGRGAPKKEGCRESRGVKGDEWEHSEVVHQGCYQLPMQREPSLPRETGVGGDPDVGEGVSKLGGIGKAPEKEWDRERENSSGLVKGIDALAVLGTRDTEMTLRYSERMDGEMERAWLGAAPRMPRESEMADHEEEEMVPAVRRKEQPYRNVNAVPERQHILGEEKPRNESLFTEHTGSYHTESKRPMCDMDHHSRLPEGGSREKKPESGDGGSCTTLEHGPFHEGGKADMDGALSRSHADRENTKRVLDGNQDRAVASTMDSSKPGYVTAVGEVLIPRTHFYVRERGSKLCVTRQGKEERGKVSAWRGNWEAVQPAVCCESLQEAIGQSGLEKVLEGEGESRIGLGGKWEAYAREEEDMQGKERKVEEDGGRELERELRMREVVDQQQVSMEEKETVISAGSERVGKIQRGPCVYTSSSLGVIQEVGLPKPSPPLPASVSPSQLLLAAKAEARASSAATPVAGASPYIQERQHVEDSESGQKGRRFTEEGGNEEEECTQSPSPSLTTSIDVPPSSSSPTPPSVVNMSRIYNQKPVVPRSALSIGERKTEKMSPTLKAQGRESPLQSHRLPLTQDNPQPKGEILEQQSLPRMELKPTWWQACQRKPKEEMNIRGQEAQRETVRQQVELLKLEAEPQAPSEASNQQELLKGSHLGLKDSSKPSPLLQQYQKVDQRTFPKDQETSNGTKPTQQLSNQELPLQQPPNQYQPSRSFTINPKSSPVLENPPQIQECKDVVAPSASLSPSSSSPSTLPNAPLFSLRNTSAGPGKRGNTITIVPRRSPAAGKPATDPGANRTAPQTQAPISGDASKKRYPTVEEIVVIGGYKKLEKSCLSKHRKTPKGVTVCFDEAQLEQVCEYPSESAMLASLPCSTPDSEKEAEEKTGGQEEEEEEEEETVAFALSSKRMAAGKGRVLRVDESCRR